MLLSSDVSEDGLAMRVVGVCSCGCVSDWQLKQDALGKKMISVLDFCHCILCASGGPSLRKFHL